MAMDPCPCPSPRARVPAHATPLIVAALLLLPSLSLAADAPDPVSPEVETAVARGLEFLAHQQKPTGAFDLDGPPVAMTGLCLTAFLASGHMPNVGKYGNTVNAAVEYLLKIAPDDGYFGRVDGSRMYGHGIVTVALAEVYGMEQNPAQRKRIRAVLQKCLNVILTAQAVNKDPIYAGGWRYEPQSADSDLSLSGWCALGLRACQNAGLTVPKEPARRAVQFVLRCHNPGQEGFCYQPNQEARISMTGVAVLNLYLMESAALPQTKAGAKYLAEHPVTGQTPMFYYSLYYANQAAAQVGEPLWPAVWKNTQQQLLPTQQPDGGWPASITQQEPGRLYASAMSVLTLSVPLRLLPIYQR